MTKISLNAALATRSIDHLGDNMFHDLGGLYPAVVLLEVCERTEPADEDGDRKVKLKVVSAEVPVTDANRERLREQLRAMYRTRTDEGGLFDPDGQTTVSFNGGPEIPLHTVQDRLAAAGLHADDEEEVDA